MEERSVKGLDVIGMGVNAFVYKLDDEKIIKVYHPGVSLEEVERERRLARSAFVSGIPAAITYETVKCGESYGIIFEMLTSDTLGHVISCHPDEEDHYIRKYVDFVKHIHSIHIKQGTFEDIHEVLGESVKKLSGICSDRELHVLMELIGSIPEGDTLIHDMVKINGNRVEPAEIEAAAKKVLQIQWCAARAFLKPDSAYICLYYKEDIAFDKAETVRAMNKYLPDYMLPSHFMKIDEIPLNANGKMDRKMLPEPDFGNDQTSYEAPMGELEEKICKAMENVLHISRVGRKDDFYSIGGDSIKTIRLVSELGIEGISVTDIFRERTAENLAGFCNHDLQVETEEEMLHKELDARKKTFPLISIQKDFYDIQMKKPDSLMWVIPTLYFFENADETKLLNAVEELKEHHPIFGTVLVKGADGVISQRYAPELMIETTVEQSSEEEMTDKTWLLKDKDLPFEMFGRPLAKIRMIRTEKGIYLYLLFHHVMTDGTGILVMLNNLAGIYEGKKAATDCYYSYLEREKSVRKTDKWRRDREKMESLYRDTDWTSQIMPVSQERGEENGVLGTFTRISEEELSELEKKTGLSRMGLFQAVMILSLAKYTGKRDILINWIYSNRGEKKKDSIASMIIKSMTLGVHLDRIHSIGELYREIKEQILLNVSCSDYEWCHENPPKDGEDRLFFVYEGAITDFDRLEAIGGKQVQLLSNNQAVVHSMSSQVLDWEKNGDKGLLLTCYYIASMYRKEEMDEFKLIMAEMASLIFTKGIDGDYRISDILNTDKHI